MAAFMFEVEGLSLVVKILESIIDDEDKDTLNSKRSKELLEHCNEILENYIGIDNDFTCPVIKSLYHEFLLDILDQVIGRGLFSNFKNLEIKNIQLCEQNDDLIMLHVSEVNGGR